MEKDLTFQFKHAVITGGAKGIGACISRAFAELGADLTIIGRDAAALETLKSELKRDFNTRCLLKVADVSNHEQVESAFASSKQELGACDILVNNAGSLESQAFHKMEPGLWQKTIDTNLNSVFYCSRQVISGMLERKSGRIVNIASTAGLKAYPYLAAYVAAKHGVIGLTKALALETANKGVTVNAVCPGYTDTDLLRGGIKKAAQKSGKPAAEVEKEFLRQIPSGKFVKPTEVSAAVIWLCQPEQASVTGIDLIVAGGEQV